MTETLRVNGLSDDESVLLNRLAEQLDAKSRRNRMRSDRYDGKRAVKMVGDVIPAQYRKLAVVLGWAAKGVDGLGRRCNIDRFAWAGGDLDSIGLPELLDSNYLLSELSQARTDSLIHGVSYLVTTQGLAGEPTALVHAKDALQATGDWNPRTRAMDNLLSVTGWDDRRITAFTLYLDGVTINAEHDSSGWQVDRSEHPWGVPVDPLVYKPRTSRRYGKSRISRPVMTLQDAAVRAVIRLEAHMDIYAIPKLMLLGGDESMFKNADGSYKSSWQVVFGRVFGIPDDHEADPALARVDVKQFSAESPEPHLAHLNALAKLTARELDLPDSDFAITDMANPTSEGSYKASRENLIAEAEGATDDWSVPIRRTVTRALAIQNGLSEVPDDWRSIGVKWRNPIYLTRAEEADAGVKQLSQVPWLADTRVGLELLGLDPQQIDDALAERKAVAGRALLTAVANRRAGNVAGN